MPFNEVMSKFKHGDLHSGSKAGPKVSNKRQAVAIMLSEKRQAEGGNKEYASKKGHKPLEGLKKAHSK
jgi:hypothetical protein